MIAQFILTALLGGLLLYAVKEARKSPTVGVMSVIAALGGLYVVWIPAHASALAHWSGIGRGADLVLYLWAAISIIIMLNLHLKLRSQLEQITALSRAVALRDAGHARGYATTARRDAAQARGTDAGSARPAVARPFKGRRVSH